MNDSPAAILYDAAGNPVDIVTIGSQKHLSVAAKQDVVASTGNNSTSNIASGATWTGTGETSLGVVGLQVNFAADQPATVYVDQSMDNTNWDITDSWDVEPNQGCSRTFQATASYFRVRVKNTGTATTTYLRLQTALCPCVEALPRTLSQRGNLKVSIQEQQQFADVSAGRLFSTIHEMTTANSETPFALFRNPSANTKDFVLNTIMLDVTTKGQSTTCRFYVNPTIAGPGTALTCVNRRLKGASPPASSALAYHSPTVVTFGTFAFSLSPGASTNSLPADLHSGIIIGPGYDILVTSESTSTGTKLCMSISWMEY